MEAIRPECVFVCVFVSPHVCTHTWGEHSHLFQVKGEGCVGKHYSDYSVLTWPCDQQRWTRFTEVLPCLFVFSCGGRTEGGRNCSWIVLNCFPSIFHLLALTFGFNKGFELPPIKEYSASPVIFSRNHALLFLLNFRACKKAAGQLSAVTAESETHLICYLSL